MEFELGELFVHAVRQVLPIASGKGLIGLSDCEGPCVYARGAATELRHCLHRVFCSAVDVLDSGFIFFSANVALLDEERCVFDVHAAGTGIPAPAEALTHALARLGMVEPPGGSPRRSAHGQCAGTGAELSFLGVPPDGSVFSLSVVLPRGRQHDDPPNCNAMGAPAWVVVDEPRWARLLEHQLQHLGWAVTLHASAAAAEQQLCAAHPQARRPALVIGLQSPQVTLVEMEHLSAGLPQAQVVLGLKAGGAEGLACRRSVELRPFPFSPGDLFRFTQRVAEGGPAGDASGHTQPAPLVLEDRRRVLVVDDNPVNQLVASGMLQALGFEVEAAADGHEAIARCSARAPDAVLMDVQMPGLDGLEATRQLRALQRAGRLQPFPIIASTAGDSGSSRRSCLDAGMDAYLGKPLSLTLLEAEMRRMLPDEAG